MGERKRRGESVSAMGNKAAISERAIQQVRASLDAMQRNKEQLAAFLAGLRAEKDLPDDWVFDTRRMAFFAPAAADEQGDRSESVDGE